MQHQGSIGLTDSQREALQGAIQEAQSTMLKVQFALSGEAEKLAKLLEAPRIEEGSVLSQVDRILGIERELKRAQMTLMIRIKNTLTPEQQSRLRSLRG
jgi:Spy/CpxP family protein refolding chaperone